jgi:hypothetical protein
VRTPDAGLRACGGADGRPVLDGRST